MSIADTQLPRSTPDVSEAARDVARRLGPAARSLLLVRPPGAGGWAARGCLALAGALGTHRARTLLLSLEGPGGELDPLLGIGAGPGLTEVFRGEAAMADVVVRSAGRGFLYAPAGERPAPPMALLDSRGMAHLLDRAREGGGTVLLYVGSESLSAGTLPDRLDGCIHLGDPGPHRTPVTLPVLARVPAPTPGGTSGTPGSSTTGAGDTLQRRSGLSRPVRPPGAERTPRTGVNRGLALDPEAPAAGSRPVRWWQLLVVCALAAALGLGIVWADSRDLWSRWIMGDAEKTPAASTQH